MLSYLSADINDNFNVFFSWRVNICSKILLSVWFWFQSLVSEASLRYLMAVHCLLTAMSRALHGSTWVVGFLLWDDLAALLWGWFSCIVMLYLSLFSWASQILMGSLRVWATHFHFSLSCIGEGNGHPLQCSCLENPRDGGAWWAPIGSYRVRHDWSDLAAAAVRFSRDLSNLLPEGCNSGCQSFRSYMEGGKLSVSTVLKILISSPLFHIVLIFELYPLNQRPSISTF